MESPGEVGVGKGLICVAVGPGEVVATAGAVEDSPAEEQAVKMNSPMKRILSVVFMGITENRFTFNTCGSLGRFLVALTLF